jgi:uncharacterized protein YpiB (UPF0302 family)
MKEPVESLMRLEHEHQDIYEETLYTIYRISFSRNYCIEISALEVYISPFQFITRNHKHETDDHARPEHKQNLMREIHMHMHITDRTTT